jgi:hypothetical protein
MCDCLYVDGRYLDENLEIGDFLMRRRRRDDIDEKAVGAKKIPAVAEHWRCAK